MSSAEALARRLSDLERRLTAMERGGQMSRTSIEAGALVVNDDAGTPVLLVGQQDDGTFAVAGVNGGQVRADTVPQEVIDQITADLELADGAVTEAKLAAAAVTVTKIADNSISSPKVIAGAIQADHLAVDSVAAGKIAANAVTAREIAALSVTAGKIAAGAVTTDKLTVSNASAIAQRIYDACEDLTDWARHSGGTGTVTVQPVTDGVTGGNVFRAVGGVHGLARLPLIPFDPTAIYRLRVRVRQTVAPSDPAQAIFYAGFACVAADGQTYISSTGTQGTTTSGAHYVAAQAVNLTAGSGWQEFTGYLRGTAATGTGTARPDPNSPGVAVAGTRYMRPVVYMNYNNGSGTAELDLVAVDVIPVGSVGSVVIADGAISAPKIAAGTITADRLAIGVGNLVPDPSFESADLRAVRTGGGWAYDTGSAIERYHGQSFAYVTGDATPNKDVYLTDAIPTRAGEQFFGSFAALANGGANGTAILFYDVTLQDGSHVPSRLAAITSAPTWMLASGVTALGSDTFDGRTASSGLGTSTGGATWAVAGPVLANFSVGSGTAKIAHSVNDNALRSAALNVSVADSDQVFSVSTSALMTGGALVTGAVARFTDQNNCYWLRVEFNPGGINLQAKIVKRVGGIETQLASLPVVPGLAYGAGTFVRVRARVSGSDLSLKVWASTSAEPSAWTLTVSDPDPALAGAGKTGFVTWLVGSSTNTLPVTATFDDYTVSSPSGLPVTMPANAVSVRFALRTSAHTVGKWCIDAVDVRRVAPGVEIADGAITAAKIAAGAITADKLDANAITGKTITGGSFFTRPAAPRVEMGETTYEGGAIASIKWDLLGRGWDEPTIQANDIGGGNRRFQIRGPAGTDGAQGTTLKAEDTDYSWQVSCWTDPLTAISTYKFTPSGGLELNVPRGSGAKSLVFNEGYVVYADNAGSGGANNRWWLDTPNLGEVVIGPRAGASLLGSFKVRTGATTTAGANVNLDTGTYQVRRVSSALKYKTDVQDLAYDPEVLRGLRPARFRDRNEVAEQGDSARWYCGFIAEEVDALGLAELVTYDSDGAPDALQYERFAAALVLLIRDQDRQLAELRQRVSALEGPAA